MTFAPCDQAMYESLGAGSDHPSCASNFEHALAAINTAVPRRPDPINLFQNTPIDNGSYQLGPSLSQAGDYVEFRAEQDLLLVVTACSVDVAIDGVQANGGRSTPLKVQIFDDH